MILLLLINFSYSFHFQNYKSIIRCVNESNNNAMIYELIIAFVFNILNVLRYDLNLNLRQKGNNFKHFYLLFLIKSQQ